MEKKIIYEVLRITYTTKINRWGDSVCTHTGQERALYTSRNKAVDRARSFAGIIRDWDTRANYNAVVEGRAKSYDDYYVVVDEYLESEGKLNFEDRHHFAETNKGEVHRHEDTDKFFMAI